MSALDVDALLAPVSADTPCGENLEYDADYVIMEQAALGKPEQQFGSTVIPAEEPNWREVMAQALALLPKSKDLRVGVYLARAAVRTDGLAGLADGLSVLSGFVERYWDGMHPQLDPDDGNDPTLRINSLASLGDGQAMLKGVREAPLVGSRALGRFSYRDVLVASGELPPPAGTAAVEQTSIDGAFAECDANELRSTAEAVERALSAARDLEEKTNDKVGAGGLELTPLTDLLASMNKLVQQKMSLRGLTTDEPEAAAISVLAPAAADGHAAAEERSAGAGSNGRKAGAGLVLTGDISSREDVIRALDKICDYYKRYEPSSPVPLFLNRAKRLASKSFLEILRDLTPDALSQALALGGIESGSEMAAAAANDV
jgi:type VI secretion system protein ImpA